MKLEALSSKGERVGWGNESRWRPNYGSSQGRVFEPVNRPGGLLWLIEGECDALALMICGYGGLVRSVGSAGNLRLATATDREQRAIVLVADGDPKGRAAAWKLHDEIATIGPERQPQVREFETGDPAELLGPAPSPVAWEELLAAAGRGDDLLNLLPSGPQA